MKANKKQFLLILGIIALATLIRLFSINNRSIWFDEAFSFFVANQSLSKLIWATAADNHPPFYYLLLHFWLKLGGSETTLRLLSLIFGALSIPLVFAIGKTIHSKRVGLWAAMILAVSPLNVYFSQETRMYALAIFLNLLAFFFFLRLVRKESLWSKAGFIVSLSLGLYTHYYFLFSWLAFNFLFILIHTRSRQKISSWLSSQVLIFLIFLPWIIIFVNNQHPEGWRYPLLLAIPATFAAFAVGGVGSITLRTILLGNDLLHIKLVSVILGLWMGFLFLYGIISQIRRKGKGVAATGYLLVPILFAALFSLVKPIYSPRSLIIFSPFYYLIITIAIFHLKTKTLKLLSLSFTLFLSSILLSFMHFNPLFWGDPIKIVAKKPFIDYQSGDAIAHASIYSYYPFRYYHQDEFDEYLIFDSGLSKRTTKIIGGTPVPIEELTQRYKRLWFVGITFLSPPQDVKTTVSNLSSKHKLVSSSKHNNIEVYLFDIIQKK